MPFVELIASLGTIAGAHGVGRVDLQKRDAAGAEWRIASEAPSGVVLHYAHGELQRTAVAPEVERFSRLLSAEYSDLIDNGLWFSPLREALDVAVDRIQQRVSGTIRMKLFKGGCLVAGGETASQAAMPDAGARDLVLPLAFSSRKP
jgi:argininosuccinate synthase